jgi:hypothetical protein
MTEEAPSEEGAAVPEKKKPSPIALIGLVVLGLTVLLLAGLGVIGGLAPGALEVLRDIAIVFLAILAFFAMVLLIFLLAVIIWGVNRLAERLDALLQQGSAILEKLKGTATTVKGTTDFVGERVASPFIWVAARTSAIRKGLVTFFRGKKETGGSQ